MIEQMKYYSIRNGLKHIGRGGYPQAQETEMDAGRKVTDRDSVRNLVGNRFPDFEPYMGIPILKDGSALTDIISSSAISGFICNDKVREIIEQHNVPETRFFKMRVKHKGVYHANYQLLHCVNNYIDQVDYGRSFFQIRHIGSTTSVVQPYAVRAYEEYAQKRSELIRNLRLGQVLEPVEIRFKEGFQPKHDMFIIWGITFLIVNLNFVKPMSIILSEYFGRKPLTCTVNENCYCSFKFVARKKDNIWSKQKRNPVQVNAPESKSYR